MLPIVPPDGIWTGVSRSLLPPTCPGTARLALPRPVGPQPGDILVDSVLILEDSGQSWVHLLYTRFLIPKALGPRVTRKCQDSVTF